MVGLPTMLCAREKKITACWEMKVSVVNFVEEARVEFAEH